MNNKKLLVFSFVSLILFGLILNFVFGTEQLSSSSVTITAGDTFVISNWTKSNVNSTVNFTLAINSADNNISNITIGIPNNVLIYDLGVNDSGLSNGTYVDSGNWECHKPAGFEGIILGDDSWLPFIECRNSTSFGINGSTINIWFNITANDSVEGPSVWTINTQDDTQQFNTTEISTNVDGLAPRLVELNVSDGYTALGNGTSAGSLFSLSYFSELINQKDNIDNGTLRADGSLVVTATLNDAIDANAQNMLTSNSVYLYYLKNDTGINESAFIGGVTPVLMTTSDSSSPYRFTGVITGLNPHNVTSFVLVVNDTFDNSNTLNDTDGGPFAVFTNTSVVPVLSLVNITDGTYNISVSTGGYLRSGENVITINAEGKYLLSGPNDAWRDLSIDGVYLYYNTTGNLTTGVNGYVAGMDASKPLLLNNNTVSSYSAIYTSNASSSSIATGNDTNTIYYAIVANNTNGTYYTLLTGQYTIDDSGPLTPTLTSDDADNRISNGGSITLTCSANDENGVGVDTYNWKVARGGEGENTVTDQTTGTLTLSSTSTPNTNRIDTYTIKCFAYDKLGHAGGEKSITITVSSSGGGTAAGAGGGSSSSTAPSFDVDLSTSTTGSISGTVGRIRSFSFDGNTKHTVTFKEITATSAKVTIASTPIDVVLNVGETKKVDINSDGTDDLEVTLDNIKFGTNAEITIKKLETGAAKIVEEEKTVTETETNIEAETTGETTKGTGWLWVTILIIVVLVTVGYYVFKKK